MNPSTSPPQNRVSHPSMQYHPRWHRSTITRDPALRIGPFPIHSLIHGIHRIDAHHRKPQHSFRAPRSAVILAARATYEWPARRRSYGATSSMRVSSCWRTSTTSRLRRSVRRPTSFQVCTRVGSRRRSGRSISRHMLIAKSRACVGHVCSSLAVRWRFPRCSAETASLRL